MINMVSETSWVDFDFQVLITWGKKVVHERAPAIIPTTSLFILTMKGLIYMLSERNSD